LNTALLRNGLFGLLLSVAWGVPSAGQETNPVNLALTSEQVERAIAELEQTNEIPVDIKFQSIDNYKAALKNLQSAAVHEECWHTLVQETESVAQRAEQLKRQRSQLKTKPPAINTNLTLQELEQLLPPAELQLSAHKQNRLDAETALQTRSPRRKEIRARMAQIQERVTDSQTQLRALTTVAATPQSNSLIARLATRRLTLEKEMASLEAELAKYDAEESADFVRLQIDLATSNVAYTEKYVALLQQQINVAREAAAEASVRKARSEAIAAAPALKGYAEQNQQLAEKSKSIAEALAKTVAELKAATEVHEGLIRQFTQTKKKVDSVGLTSSVGALLRKQRTTLPDGSARQQAVANRQAVLNDTQYQLFEYEDAYQELGELDDSIAAILATATAVAGQPPSVLESAVRDLMFRRREYLEALIRSNGQYFDALVELDTTDQQVVTLTSEYKNYIDQRVLWIRSGPALTAGIALERANFWLFSPVTWRAAGEQLASDARQHFALYLVVLSTLGLLILRGRHARRTVREIGDVAQKANCLTILPTLHVLLWTCALSMAWPLLCLFVGWRFDRLENSAEFTTAIGHGFWTVGMLWLSVELIRQICRPHGLGEAHFRWPTAVTSTLRRELRYLIFLAIPFVFVGASLAAHDGAHDRGDWQRIVFILAIAIACLATYRILRPQGMLREYFAGRKGSWIDKTKYIITFAAVGVPLSLATLAATGYQYTAQTLAWRLFATGMFVAALILTRAICLRMLLLRRRYLSMEQSRQRAAAAKLNSENAGPGQPVAGIVTEDPQADISAHSMQSRRLVSTAMIAVSLVGLWMIWVQVLPALGMLDNYPLWGGNPVEQFAGFSTPAMPSPVSAGNPETTPSAATTAASSIAQGSSDVVTLSDLGLAILIAVVTFVLSRNGPGLLEMSVLQQLPLDASVRYAITTLVSYAIVLIGTIAACSTIGLQWSQIQWLATALTFGLAFGLQEIFANFVAGLIILLERPIRVGDIVTVDEVSGVVSRIRIRATSITNWDRKEYVVPNKEFITGRLLNWTLSDKINRIVINVGLAYGSDTELARELLLAAAAEHPLVLKDPNPMATFEGFGDNSLNFVLRAFLPSLENRLDVVHELHTAIDRSFRSAGLEIAFPQRDLHIRSIPTALRLALAEDEREAA
jgi:potassium efflux system protein